MCLPRVVDRVTLKLTRIGGMRSVVEMKCSDRKELEIGRWCREKEKVEDLFRQAKSDGYYVAYKPITLSCIMFDGI